MLAYRYEGIDVFNVLPSVRFGAVYHLTAEAGTTDWKFIVDVSRALVIPSALLEIVYHDTLE